MVPVIFFLKEKSGYADNTKNACLLTQIFCFKEKNDWDHSYFNQKCLNVNSLNFCSRIDLGLLNIANSDTKYVK